jgi:predicted 3-demethylubiquinone-9 3-methyltransferase (glyoxalase superfamily)
MNAEEAVNYYASIFNDARIGKTTRYGPGGPLPEGTVMTIEFQLEGQDFIALNGGPHFQFSQAISFFVKCRTQEEVDLFWEKLSDGGEKQRCAWLKDKFGVTWQIVPTALGEMLSDADPEKAKRVVQTMLQMTKIDIAKLQDAYNG